MTATHSFEDCGDGRTEYTWSISFEELSVVARPFIAILRRLFKRALANQSQALASYLGRRPVDDSKPPI